LISSPAIFGEGHKLKSSSKYNFLQSPHNCSLLGPNIFFCVSWIKMLLDQRVLKIGR
jgi:hypothetical protein